METNFPAVSAEGAQAPEGRPQTENSPNSNQPSRFNSVGEVLAKHREDFNKAKEAASVDSSKAATPEPQPADVADPNRKVTEAENKPQEEAKAKAEADPRESKDVEDSSGGDKAPTNEKEAKRFHYYKRQAEKAEKQLREMQEQALNHERLVRQMKAQEEQRKAEYEKLAGLLGNSGVDSDQLYQLSLENQIQAHTKEQELQQQLSQWEAQQRQEIERQAKERAYQFQLEQTKVQLEQEIGQALTTYPNVPEAWLRLAAAQDTKRPIQDIAKDIWENQILSKVEPVVLEKHKQKLSAPKTISPSGHIPVAKPAQSVEEVVERYRTMMGA